jgi:hypothetical protein
MARGNGRKHGLTGAKRALREYGARAIDARTKAARELAEWTAEIVADLGGEDQISAQQRTVIELAGRTRFLLNGIDAWLIQQPSMVNKSKRRLFDVVQQRQQLSDALARYMNMLGLERKRADPEDLTSYIEEQYTVKE